MVIVVTTGVTTVEGAIQGGIGFVVIQQLLTYAPQRFQGLTVVFFALGALTYAAHPEGVLEFQKRRWTARFERALLRCALPGGALAGDRRGGARVDEPVVWCRSLAIAHSLAGASGSVSKGFGGIQAVQRRDVRRRAR